MCHLLHTIDLSLWNLPSPWRITPLPQGVNNPVMRVDTSAGSYVLRVLRNYSIPWTLDRLRFEQTVLMGLRDSGLPFAVPVLIPTEDGALWAFVSWEEGEALATLTPLIPGVQPRGDDREQAVAAGEALAQLDLVLAKLALPAGPNMRAAISWRSTGDLMRCHPLVPDPSAALASLPLPDDARSRLLTRYAWVVERIADLYARLPMQLMHVDYHPTNLLMEGPRVTGVLDFEFCSRDLRVMDLTVALTWWPEDRFGTGEEWPVLRALAQGYAHHITLTPDEIAAVPTLFQYRAYTSLIHRLGRYLARLNPLEAVVERASATLEREDWLEANGARLVEMLREVNQ